MENIKQRSFYWDNIKGFLIILVVFAHIVSPYQAGSKLIKNIYNYMFMFHMPAFVFISGYFGKSEHSRSNVSIARLIFLYYIFNSATGLIFGFRSILSPLDTYWYLIALIVWRITAYYLEKHNEIELILLTTAIFAGFYPSIDNTFAVSRIIAFYPYYMFGYKLAPEKSNELISTKYSKRFFKGMICLIITASAAYSANQIFDYNDRQLCMYSYGYSDSTDISSFGRIALYIIAFLAIYTLRNLCPDEKIPFLSVFGRNSLWIYIFHYNIIRIIINYFSHLSQNGLIICSILCTFALCLIFGNDLVAKYMNKFADSGATILLGEQPPKITFTKVMIILIALGFIVSIIVDTYKEFFEYLNSI